MPPPLSTTTAHSTASTLPYIQRPTPSSLAPSAGSRTQTLTSEHNEDGASSRPPTLRLRGASGQTATTDDEGRRIRWADDVVDNEGLGRKTSKVCCIYHRPRAVGESSDEDSSDSESGDSGGDDDGAARPSRGGAHGHGDGTGPCAHGGAGGKRAKGRGGSPNAYEKMPNVKGKEKAGQ